MMCKNNCVEDPPKKSTEKFQNKKIGILSVKFFKYLQSFKKKAKQLLKKKTFLKESPEHQIFKQVSRETSRDILENSREVSNSLNHTPRIPDGVKEKKT